MDAESLLFENVILREKVVYMEEYIKSLHDEIVRLRNEKRALELQSNRYFGPYNRV